MTPKTIALIVAGATVAANLVFAMTGITSTVSCTVSNATAAVYAAFIPGDAP